MAQSNSNINPKMKLHMKKQIKIWGMMLAAAFTFTNCIKEEVQAPEVSEGNLFEIVASTVDTKTVNDGFSTNWVAGDQINLFHAVTESENYVSDGSFSISETGLASSIFTGTINGEFDPEEEYDWYAFYPYSSYIKTPANTSAGYMTVGSSASGSQTQTGNNSMAHIAGPNYPIAGFVCTVPANDKPVITMAHLSSLLEINVTNTTEEPLTVTDVLVKAPENLVGTYYINFAGAITPDSFKSSGDSYVSKSARLSITSGEAIASGQSAKFYLAVKPFVATSGKSISLLVNGYEKTVTLDSDVAFEAGKIKTLNFNYNNTAKAEANKLPWYEDFSSNDLSAYVVTHGGTNTKIYESDNLAGGTAPELLISKSNGTFTAKFATEGYSGDLTLLFKSNYPERISVSSSTSGVTVTKVSNTEYTIQVGDAVVEFDLIFKNTNSSNTRIDDIMLKKGVLLSQSLTFANASYSLELGTDEANAFTGQTVQGAQTTVVYSSSDESVAIVDAQTGAVTLMNVEGTAKIVATAAGNDEYKETTAEYLISVSLPRTGDAKQYSFEITKADFSTASYADNNKEHTSTATASDGSTLQVKWTSYQVMQQNSTMQWQKSKGYIYNTTDLGTIDSVEITTEGGTFTKYIGSSIQPTSNSNGGYFHIKVGSSTGKVTKIVVKFTK